MPSPVRFGRRVVFLSRLVQARLRMAMAVGFVFLLIATWRSIGERWDRLAGWVAGRHDDLQEVGSDTEFFCPMCPGVLSTWPEKCPVCKMPLVRRSRAEAGVLPDGVIARMQLTPYRVQLAGIRTSEVAYRPLVHTTRLTGRVERRRDSAAGAVTSADRGSDVSGDEVIVRAVVSPLDVSYLAVGQAAFLERLNDLPHHLPHPPRGRLQSLERLDDESGGGLATIALESAGRWLGDGQQVSLRLERPFAEIEPYCSQPRNPAPRSAEETRRVFYSDRFPQQLFLQAGKSPFQDGDLIERKLQANQRLLWWSPADALSPPKSREVLLARLPESVICPTVVTYVPAGEVLAVPDSALIESAHSQIVFVETMPGMFDGVRVDAGPLVDGYRPVIGGLTAGQRVVTNGAFLLDAETRLNPALAASYFGSGNQGGQGATNGYSSFASAGGQADEADLDELRELSPYERSLAGWQRICPVTRAPLGSMGELTRVEFQGRYLFLCCDGCVGKIPGGRVVAYADSKSAASNASPADEVRDR